MIEKTRIAQQHVEERAVLVGVCQRGMTFEQTREYLDELAFLTRTAGAKPVRSFIQNLDKPIPATYVGAGKLEEIKVAIEESEANLVIFDDDLSPSQTRNIDKVLNVKVIDRSALILHIFSERAQTAQARIQVELAQYQYMLPRLAGLWTHLSKQRGGIGLKGAGEKEIETDRRILRNKISQYKKELQKIDRQEATRRKNRGYYVRVALVGYTNVGKSTLMNLLSKSKVYEENKLFATLDTTVRKVSLGPLPFLLSDTVGFIRKLPTHLVESFKSTLDEARESDILLHVVDASHPSFEEHIQVVKETLEDIDITGKKVITVFNKFDLLDEETQQTIRDSYYRYDHLPAVFISARAKWNIETLREMLAEEIADMYRKRPANGYHFLEAYTQLQAYKELEQEG
ncbi:MAG: GTPase HflX [Bacteroidota bacterium]